MLENRASQSEAAVSGSCCLDVAAHLLLQICKFACWSRRSLSEVSAQLYMSTFKAASNGGM